MTTDRTTPTTSPIARALVIAGALLGITLALRALAPEHLSVDFVRRASGVLLGIIVIGYANLVPKALSPLITMRCDAATEQALRRFTGWSLVAGGLAYSLCWMLAPLVDARLRSVALLGTAVLLVVGRVALALTPHART